MNKILFAISAAVSLSAFGAPFVDPQSVVLSQSGGKTSITYTLTGDPAIITLDIQTNTTGTADGPWVSIGESNIRYLSGAVNRLVREVGVPQRIEWKAGRSWPKMVIPGPNTRAVVTAWATNMPPDYMVVDLTQPKTVNYYASSNAIPGGMQSEVYKTSKLVMRKISAAGVRWRMGSPSSQVQPSTQVQKETPHFVTLTSDYYMGVYEVTQKQYQNIYENAGVDYSGPLKGSKPSSFKNMADSDRRPVESINLVILRGDKAGYNWPEQADRFAVDPDRVLGKFRAYVGGGILFDLPSEAEWEFACRAGVLAKYYDGRDDGSATNLAWSNASEYEGGTAETRPVGLLEPNGFGLYDMLGNVSEMCQDWYDSKSSVPPDEVIDPMGLLEAEIISDDRDRLTRGGWYSSDPVSWCRCGARYRVAPDVNWGVNSNGFRLYAPAVVGD